jgi:hypothetical protein
MRLLGPRAGAAPQPAVRDFPLSNPHFRLYDMNRKGDKSLIVGLDIGTSKVIALVGEYSPGNPIEVIGIGSHESRGLKRGVVVDIESTVQSIQRAVEEAELMAGCEIRSVYASISGNHVQCKNSPGIVPIRDGEVTWGDLDRVLERPRRWRSRPTRRSCTRSRASTCWTTRRKASAIPSADRRAPGGARAPGGVRAVGRGQHQQVRSSAAACRSTT